MKYKSFRIRNFKGIKDTTVSLESLTGANVFAFVGLNESGKTTVLEAIHSFSPDKATSELLGGDEETGVPFSERVPRHQLSSFSGDVSVSATLILTDEDKSKIAQLLFDDEKITVNTKDLPSELTFERQQRFEDGDFVKSYFTLRASLQIKTASQRKWREPTVEESARIRNVVYQLTPDICYFPTFVFEFPDKIYLTDLKRGELSRFYRSVFQDILDYDGKGFTIEKDITRRVRNETLNVPWLQFFGLWSKKDDAPKIQHVIDRASSTVSKVVFGRWNKIFGEDTHGKEVVITFDISEGETKDKSGVISKTTEHDIFISFVIRDGTRRFNVNDRSLGFRWFFAFMLFTQFRVARSNSRPLLFLFDEPASNLHAAAQQKLVDCFPQIAQKNHALIYTTHSHYMIEPKWLEQTFIVTNRSDTPPSSVLDAVSLDDESLDIQVTSYRSFVDRHPGQTSYFQPILDRLEVVPSRFDIKRASIVVEGKSDYYILRYAMKMLRRDDLPIMPGLGAGTFGALAAMHVGWNLNFLFILDADKQGKTERLRYALDFGIPLDRVVTINTLLDGLVQIEDLIDEDALDGIRKSLGISSSPSKAQIRRFFQERLAGDDCPKLSDGFAKSATSLLDAIKLRMSP
ncbi:AAA family ATPase [Belnapia rosea]|uniref:AAA domain-containing protein n=1 Tax=Belnapia rosea TaxID=938405 RepID=A0A1G6SXG7_9PROT|nr:AAA family ATPase [Belnapia rosea]SDD21463.1 AAA domain-containing protein [Belnapia rosea]